MRKRLEGKKALVTGAGKQTGIGFAIAKKLANEGAQVAIADLIKPLEEFVGYVRTSGGSDLEQSVAALREMGATAEGFGVDITNTDSVNEMAKSLEKSFGSLDILVNNAGGAPGTSTLQAMEERAWLHNFDLNVHGAWRVMRAVNHMFNDGGSIINMSSRAGKVPSAFLGGYCSSKAALNMMTKVAALELGMRKIRVNSICPGQINTELGRWGWKLKAAAEGLEEEEFHKVLAQRIPLKRLGLPDDVADLVVFLASEESSYLTGQAFNITGGQLMEV